MSQRLSQGSGLLYSLVIFMHYRRNVTLVTVTFWGDQLESHLHFLLSRLWLWVSGFPRIQHSLHLSDIGKFISLEIHFSARRRDDALSGSLFGKIVLGRLTFASYGLFAPRFFMFDFVPSSFFFSFQHSQLPQLFVPKEKKSQESLHKQKRHERKTAA